MGAFGILPFGCATYPRGTIPAEPEQDSNRPCPDDQRSLKPATKVMGENPNDGMPVKMASNAKRQKFAVAN
jgi:hypothetical protein